MKRLIAKLQRSRAARRPAFSRASLEPLESRVMLSVNYTDSWVGNSYGSGDGQWVQNNILGLYVTPGGTIYTDSWWDEGRREAGIYNGTDGSTAGELNSLHDSFGGGFAVAGDASYIYAANWDLVRRCTLTGASAPFSGGVGAAGDSIDTSTNPTGTDKSKGVMGLAVDKTNKLLYVSESTDNELEEWNTTTMTQVRSWPIARPGAVAVAPDGTIWVVAKKDASNAASIAHYNSSGTQLSQTITGAAGMDPTSLSFDNSGRLLVADNGPDNNIKIYSNLGVSENAPNATFGASVFSGVAGQVTGAKFATSGLTGVGTDSSGNLYVSFNGVGPQSYWNGGGTVLESYTPSGALRWRRTGLDFVDSASADATSDNGNTVVAYDKNSHYQIDMTKTAAGSDWSYVGHTLNQFKSPADQRYVRSGDTNDYTAGTIVRTVQGHKLMFVFDMQARRMLIYRFNSTTDGEVAIPSGIWESQYNYTAGYANSPTSKDFIWRDLNGNGNFDAGEFVSGPGMPNLGYGYYVDTQGNLWSSNNWAGSGVGVREWKLQGFDTYGNPVYDYSAGNYIEYQRPADSFGDIRRIIYQPETDTMYVGSRSDANGDRDAGTRFVKYTNWSQPTRATAWILDAPTDNTAIEAMSVSGDYLFLGYSYYGTNSKEGTINVYQVSNAQYVGKITPAPEIGSGSGAFDIPYAIQAYKSTNGQYLIFAEEDHYAKVVVHRWNPTGTTVVDDLNDLSLTDASRSTTGWSIDTSNAGAYFLNDPARATRSTDTTQSLVWQVAGLRDFSAAVYYGSPANIDSAFSAFTSTDGSTWTPLAVTRTASISSGGGWMLTNFRANAALPAGTKFLKLQINATTGQSWNVQIGRVELFGPLASTTRTDNLNNLAMTDWARTTGAWSIDGSNPSYFNGDFGRAIRGADVLQYLAWNGANLTTFNGTVYYDRSLNIDNLVSFQSSTDGSTWTTVTTTRTATTFSGGGNWGVTVFTPASPLPPGTGYIRLQISPTGVNWNTQVGRMDIVSSGAQATLVDPLNDLSKTTPSLNTSGWSIDGSNASFFNGDAHRATRSTDTTQSLVWNYTNISNFSANIYYDQALNIDSLVTFYTSIDGVNWSLLSTTRTATTSSGGGNWGLTTFSGQNLPAGTNFLKMQIAPTGTSWNVQLGQMQLVYG